MPQVQEHVLSSVVEMIGLMAFNPTTRELDTRYGKKSLTYSKLTLPATVERNGFRQPTTDFRFADSIEVQDWGAHADKTSRDGQTLADFKQGDPVKIIGRLSESRWKTGDNWNSKVRVEILDIESVDEAEMRELLSRIA